jgi:hypothetical protein
MTRLPDFLIAGAPRSGSTTLYRMIDEHPSVFMARPKEVRFFNGPHVHDIEWYGEHFADADSQQIAGEATPWYLHDPKAVRAMKEVVPNALIIVILRDPVDRTYSHYWMERIRGRATGSFEAFLESSDVLHIGHYADHLEYLTKYFPRDQVLVVFHQDLESDPAKLYAEVCAFLGVDPEYAPPTLGATVNRYVEFRSLRVRDWAKAMPRSLAIARRTLDKLNTRTRVSYPPMHPETREGLAKHFEIPNAELASWLGQPLPSWTRPTGRT